MITITVGDVQRHAMPDEYFRATHCNYVVKFVLANAPRSLDWQIDLLTLSDCQSLESSSRHVMTVGEAERLLIKRYSPTINRANNSIRPARPGRNSRSRRQAPALPEFSTEHLADVGD